MDKIKKFTKHCGCDVGYNGGGEIEPLNGEGRRGVRGINKEFTLEKMISLAYQVKANIIVKSGKRGKWYLKQYNTDDIFREIDKQKWRDTSRATMWIIEWD